MAGILVLEDNEDCITIYRDILLQDQLIFARSLSELDGILKTNSNINLLIADLNLPDGFFLNWVIGQKSELMSQTPTIIVSVSEDLGILTSCFEWGASDYLIKPFRRGELKAKTSKALGHFVINKKSSEDEASEIIDELTLIEGKIFRVLFENVGQYVPREKIIPAIWKKVVVHPKTFDVHLSNLRKKISHTSWIIMHEEKKGWKLRKSQQ